jgi:hypothetical protein
MIIFLILLKFRKVSKTFNNQLKVPKNIRNFASLIYKNAQKNIYEFI